MISCILLAAGESRRFGSPKALADIQHVKVIEFLQKKLIESLAWEIIIVTGAHEDAIKPYVFNHSKVRIVYNKDFKFGQTSSFQQGVFSTQDSSQGFMLLPVDCPFILTKTFNQLIEHFNQKRPSILLPIHKGMKGHPPIFNSSLKETILNLDVHQGMNNFMREQIVETLDIADPGIIQTFNTPEELKKITDTLN